MAAAAKLQAAEPEAPTAPDMSKPVRLKYWRCTDTIGTLTQRDVTVGGYVNDGGTQGRVRSLWFFPSAGFAVAELEVGYRPGVLEKDQSVRIELLVMTNGHGREA